jgi:hypothetical protein
MSENIKNSPEQSEIQRLDAFSEEVRRAYEQLPAEVEGGFSETGYHAPGMTTSGELFYASRLRSENQDYQYLMFGHEDAATATVDVRIVKIPYDAFPPQFRGGRNDWINQRFIQNSAVEVDKNLQWAIEKSGGRVGYDQYGSFVGKADPISGEEISHLKTKNMFEQEETRRLQVEEAERAEAAAKNAQNIGRTGLRRIFGRR